MANSTDMNETLKQLEQRYDMTVTAYAANKSWYYVRNDKNFIGAMVTKDTDDENITIQFTTQLNFGQFKYVKIGYKNIGGITDFAYKRMLLVSDALQPIKDMS